MTAKSDLPKFTLRLIEERCYVNDLDLTVEAETIEQAAARIVDAASDMDGYCKFVFDDVRYVLDADEGDSESRRWCVRVEPDGTEHVVGPAPGYAITMLPAEIHTSQAFTLLRELASCVLDGTPAQDAARRALALVDLVNPPAA